MTKQVFSFFKAFLLLCLNILTSCDRIKASNINVEESGNDCVKDLFSLDGYNKDWTIMSDDNGKTHRINLVKHYNNSFGQDDYVKFYLYTRNNGDGEEIYRGNKSTSFMPDKPLKFVSHGWRGDKEAMSEIRDAYLNSSDVNVVMVDWSAKAQAFYCVACSWVVDAGIQVGKMAHSMIQMYSLNASRIDLVGHSLGAHVVGSAGREFQLKSNGKGKIGRIFGLDPARPYFEFMPIFASLSKNDAAFVEVIHTNAGVNGVIGPHGHVDFYPNGGGTNQPGCSNYTYGCIDSYSCSHHRSVLFFAESLVTGGFTSTLCDNYHAYEEGQCIHKDKQKLGESCSGRARNSYFLDTNASPPFSISSDE